MLCNDCLHADICENITQGNCDWYLSKIWWTDKVKAFGEGVKQMENTKPIVIDCKYYLPCGICDKTNNLCSQLDEIMRMATDAELAGVNNYIRSISVETGVISECDNWECKKDGAE